jgi:D-alanyl-D-alanine carboxypeptidase
MRKNLVKFFIGIFFGGLLTYFVNFSQIKLENFLTAQITKPLEEINFVKIERPKKPPLELDVKAALSIRLNPQKKIKEEGYFSKNENEILPIASLTKLMTALVVIENQENYPLKEQIKISREAALQEDVPEYGNLKAGQKKQSRNF